MMNKLQLVVLAFGLFVVSTTTFAKMHDMAGMGEPGMYNVTVEGLAGRDDAKGIDEKFKGINGVQKVHVDFKNGMVMVWVKRGKVLDEKLTRKIVEKAGFKLEAFDRLCQSKSA